MAIKTYPGDGELFSRNVRMVEGLLAEEVADSMARGTPMPGPDSGSTVRR